MVLLSHIDTDFLIQSVSEGLARGFEIVPRLEIHPELRLHPKEAAQSQGCICRDPSLPMNNLVNAMRRLEHNTAVHKHSAYRVSSHQATRQSGAAVGDLPHGRLSSRCLLHKFIVSRTARMPRCVASLGPFLRCPSYRLINDWAIAWHGDGFTTRPRGLQPHLFGLQDLL